MNNNQKEKTIHSIIGDMINHAYNAQEALKVGDYELAEFVLDVAISHAAIAKDAMAFLTKDTNTQPAQPAEADQENL